VTQLGSTAAAKAPREARDQTRSGLTWPFRGRERRGETPKHLTGAEAKCHVLGEVYTDVPLYAGSLATYHEVRALREQQ